MPDASNNLNRVAQPQTIEFEYGDEQISYGDNTLAVELGIPAQSPEQIIVRAAYNIGIPAYASYQQGGRPVLPSIVFSSTGVEETPQFDRGHLDSQDFTITVRAKMYKEIIRYTNDYFDSLRDVAGSRYNGISGQWSDDFNPALDYRERTFSVTIRR